MIDFVKYTIHGLLAFPQKMPMTQFTCLTLPEFQHVTTDVTTAADDMPTTNDIPRKRTTGTYNDFNRRAANLFHDFFCPAFPVVWLFVWGICCFLANLEESCPCFPSIGSKLKHSTSPPRPFCPRDPSVCIVRCENHFT